MSDIEESYGNDWDTAPEDPEDLADNDNPAYKLAENDDQSYKVITTESLALAQNEVIQTVVDLLKVNSQYARTLLIHYRWNFDTFSNELAELSKDQVFKKVGLAVVSEAPLSELPPTVTCEVCYDEFPRDQVTRMDCSHVFCNGCWLNNFSVKIADGYSKRLLCMFPKCNSICDEEKVRRILKTGDPDALARYDRSLLESYVDDNGKLKWCTSVPHCGNAIKVDGEPYCEVECACSHQFCFNCGQEPHSPCSCVMWELWERKCKDESETSNWIAVHTKPCPKCNKPVEKNDGCNLVVCVCSQAFCWLCGAGTGRRHTWSSIDGHTCGRFKEDFAKRAATAERSLKRYMHYHTRWRMHLDSLKKESRERQAIGSKIQTLEQCDLEVKDYSWLTTGLDMLFKARRALAFSYPFAFYMYGNELYKDQMTEVQCEMKKSLFELQQGEFERHVERLSFMFKETVENISSDVAKFRFSFVNATAMTDKYCARLYNVIEDDLDSLYIPVQIAPYKSEIHRPLPELNTVFGLEEIDESTPGACLAEAEEELHRYVGGEDSNALKRPREELVWSGDRAKIRK